MDDQKKQQLVNYVNEQITAGTDIDTLTAQLKELGWSPDEIDEVFTAAEVDPEAMRTAQEAGPTPQPPYEETGEGITTPVMEDGTDTAERDSGSSGNGIFVAIVILLLVVGTGIATGMTLTGWSPGDLFSSRPTIEEVIETHRSVESFTYDVEFSALAEFSADVENQQQLMSALMFVPGALENGEVPASLTTQLNISGTASLSESTDTRTNIRFGIGTDEIQDLVDVEYRRVAGGNYLLGNILPDLGLINLKPLEGEWVSLGGVMNTAGGVLDQAASATGTDDVHLLNQVSPETHTELRNALQEEGVYTIKSDGKVRLDDGTDTYLFSISIHPDGIQRYLVRMEQIVEDNDPELLNSPMYNELQSYLTDTAEFIDRLNLHDDQIQVWIDQDTNYVRRVQLTAAATEDQMADIATGAIDSGTLTFTLNLSNYNQPAQVHEPTDVKTFEEAQQIIMLSESSGDSSGTSNSPSAGFAENYFGTVENSANDARVESRNTIRQSDLAQISTALELYQNDNGTYDAGLIPLDGRDEQQEVLGVYMDSVPTDPDGSDYSVNTSADGFCVSAPAYEGLDFPDNNTDCSMYDYSIGPGI